MKPHARSLSIEDQFSSPPPPPPKDLPPLAPLSTGSPKRPFNAFSPPIKRKPLPPSAFSPKALSPPTNTYQHQSRETGRSTAPASASALSHILDSPTEASPTIVQSPTYHPESSYPTSTRTPVAGQAPVEDFLLPHHPVNGFTPHIPNEKVEIPITEEGMAPGPGERPPPLRMDSVNSVKSMNTKKQSPGNKFTAFFSRKPLVSPGAESESTEISDTRSPMPSPYPQSDHGSTNSALNSYFGLGGGKHSSPHGSQDSSNYEPSIQPLSRVQSDLSNRYNILETELRDISVELAGSIKRELDLEDVVERLQNQSHVPHGDRTSDYFSDSGASSVPGRGSEVSTKDQIDKIKRDADQQRATLKVELSQRWQEEATQRKALESHLQMLEHQVAQSQHLSSQASGASTRIRELESSLDDSRRRLNEERKVKENFEDLLTALKVELEQARGKSNQMSKEIQSLKDENAALMSAREIERMHFIAEEEDFGSSPTSSMLGPRTGGFGGLSRSNTSRGGRPGLGRSGSLSRSNSVNRGSPIDNIENAAEKIKSIEQQRDALHTTVRYLRTRHEQQRRQFEKRARMLQAEADQANNNMSKKGGYEREVRVLRAEINTLRKRADDALDQKWQCEKGLAGLKMDLDRNKQETANLQKLLQARGSDPDSQALSSATLENAIVELQRERARTQENAAKIEQEQHLAEELEESAARSEALASQVKKQLHANQSLRARLKNAVENGEKDQRALTDKINDLQHKLKKYEDAITSAQIQSETAVMKHEEEVRVLRASNNAQLLRSVSGKAASNLLSPTGRSPLSPMVANSKKSPRIDNTSSGRGIPLHEALRTEYLETKVGGLEKALSDAEKEMGEVIQRMNGAQISVAELEAERDHALKQTRALEASIQAERQKYKDLVSSLKGR